MKPSLAPYNTRVWNVEQQSMSCAHGHDIQPVVMPQFTLIDVHRIVHCVLCLSAGRSRANQTSVFLMVEIFKEILVWTPKLRTTGKYE